jgi:hypothetical protein
MTETRPNWLLTSRVSSGVAVGLTALVFGLAIRDLFHPKNTRALLLPLDFLLHGWTVVAANIVFYGYLCWLSFWFVRISHKRERVVIVGWAVSILLSPIEILWPVAATALRYIETFGLGVALISAASLLLHPAPISESTRGTA